MAMEAVFAETMIVPLGGSGFPQGHAQRCRFAIGPFGILHTQDDRLTPSPLRFHVLCNPRSLPGPSADVTARRTLPCSSTKLLRSRRPFPDPQGYGVKPQSIAKIVGCLFSISTLHKILNINPRILNGHESPGQPW